MSQTTKPVIGITSSTATENNIPSVKLHERYVQSVIDAGGVPIIIPKGTKEMADVWVSKCDGIILSGGVDVDPNSYDADPDPNLQSIDGKRDEIEIELVKSAEKQKTPIFAICRGIALFNVALGGDIIQDINSKDPDAIKHYQDAARPEATHYITIDKDSRLYEVLGHTEETRVNSMHHQAIGKLASNVRKVAESPDGVIEAIEGVNESALWLGVQWHPEEMSQEYESMQGMFNEFISECIRVRAGESMIV